MLVYLTFTPKQTRFLADVLQVRDRPRQQRQQQQQPAVSHSGT